MLDSPSIVTDVPSPPDRKQRGRAASVEVLEWQANDIPESDFDYPAAESDEVYRSSTIIDENMLTVEQRVRF